MVESRQEKRKEARKMKKNSRHQSWLHHQELKKKKKNVPVVSKVVLDKSMDLQKKGNKNEKLDVVKKGNELGFVKKGKKDYDARGKPKFQEYLDLETGRNKMSADEDLELERKLAKKLKIKSRKLGGPDDGMNFLTGDSLVELDPFSGDGFSLDNEAEEMDEEQENDVVVDKKKRKRKETSSKLSKGKVAEMESLDEEEHDMNFLTGDSLDELDPFSGDGFFLDDEVEEIDEEQEDDDVLDKKKRKGKETSSKLSKGKVAEMENLVEKHDTVSTTEVKRKRKRKKSSDNLEKISEVEVVETVDQEIEQPEESNKVQSAYVKPFVQSDVKYIAPHLRGSTKTESEELTGIRRQVKRLLNKLSESNVERIVGEIATLYQALPRSVGCQIIAEEFLASSLESELFFVPFAAFVAGMACSVGIDLSARLIEYLAKSFEDEYLKGNSRPLNNLGKLLCYMYTFDIFASDLIYDLLAVTNNRLAELDISVISTILEYCGMKLRADDPAAMKDFILAIRSRVNELKQDGKEWVNSTLVQFKLETICDDIKNNKKKPKEEPPHFKQLRKWLQKLRSEEILLRGLKWSKLLDPEKKGQWWLSGDGALISEDIGDVATTISKEVLEAQKFVQLAAAQRMNTDIRRAIFCIIMSAEDYVDAFEKLLRLDLTGKQDREIMRVLVTCCLQEKVFNKYYAVLAFKLCAHDKNNKFSLQYCIWDHFKEVESMELTSSMNLAKFVAEMLVRFSLSLAVLKVVDFSDPSQLTPKRIMHFRMLFEAIFENADAVVWNIFTRIASIPELEELRSNLVFFINQYVVVTGLVQSFAAKFKIAKKALRNVAGVLM